LSRIFETSAGRQIPDSKLIEIGFCPDKSGSSLRFEVLALLNIARAWALRYFTGLGPGCWVYRARTDDENYVVYNLKISL